MRWHQNLPGTKTIPRKNKLTPTPDVRKLSGKELDHCLNEAEVSCVPEALAVFVARAMVAKVIRGCKSNLGLEQGSLELRAPQALFLGNAVSRPKFFLQKLPLAICVP